MSDIRCAVCREPWDEYGAREGDMAPWEYDLFKQGAGCPCCEGVPPEGVSSDDALVDHLASVVLDGSEDPDSYERLHDPEGDRPAWVRPEDPVVFECECGVKLRRDLEVPDKSEYALRWDIPWSCRAAQSCKDQHGSYDWSTDVDELLEIGGKKWCYGCADTCDDCGEPIFRDGGDDIYDPGASHPDPRSCFRSICTGCLEAIPTCSYCSSVLGENEETNDEGYGECCATSSAPEACEDPECDSTRFDWDSEKKTWVCRSCDREHPRDSRFE